MTLLSIDGEWYDLAKWAPRHPGGEAIIKKYEGCDATDAFYSLHSDKAAAQLKRMTPVERKEDVPQVDPMDVAFRKFRKDLMDKGWWNRWWYMELALIVPVIVGCVYGTYISYSSPWWAIAIIGVAMQQAGWLGHDMTHAKHSTYCDTMLRFVSGWINGFNRNWWSDKHNTHHVLTNHIQDDPDIHNEPILFLWPPAKEADSHYRRYQHYYFLPLYFFLYVTWRIQSIQYAIKQSDYTMLLTTLLPSYIWLACLPLTVSVGSILFGGFLVALVVTLSHEGEDMVEGRAHSYVRNQFNTTKDIMCPDPITEYLFGGMQYQLEHHLFPTLPRYKHRYIRPLVKKWAAEVGLKYKEGPLLDMYVEHWQHLKATAQAPCKTK